jgi:hypothetical protein
VRSEDRRTRRTRTRRRAGGYVKWSWIGIQRRLLLHILSDLLHPSLPSLALYDNN